VLSYAVRQRFKEIAVRMALGASRESVILTILRQGLAPVGFGVALGTLGSRVANRFLSTELYGISPTDPATMGGALLVVFVTATIACYLPARRAATLGLQGVR
jgi:ABC-type antimicrobial peptide transport system permease subunit